MRHPQPHPGRHLQGKRSHSSSFGPHHAVVRAKLGCAQADQVVLDPTFLLVLPQGVQLPRGGRQAHCLL